MDRSIWGCNDGFGWAFSCRDGTVFQSGPGTFPWGTLAGGLEGGIGEPVVSKNLEPSATKAFNSVGVRGVSTAGGAKGDVAMLGVPLSRSTRVMLPYWGGKTSGVLLAVPTCTVGTFAADVPADEV